MNRFRAFSPQSLRGSTSQLAMDVALANGQSNSIGGGAEMLVINAEPLHAENYMLAPGGVAWPRAQTNAYDWVANTTSMVPAFEIQLPAPDTQSETGWTRMLYEMRVQREAAGEAQTYLGVTGVGSGGMAIDQLSTSPPGAGPGDGGPSNSRLSLISCVRAWLVQCVARGIMPTFWMPWLQGEAQYTQDATDYRDEIIAYRNLMDADLLPLIRVVNPDHGPIQMIIGQMGVRGEDGEETDVGEGQLMAAIADPNIWIIPTHNIPKFDNYHHSEVGRQFLAGQFAAARRELLQTGEVRSLRMVGCTTTDWVNFDVSITDHPTDDTILQVTDGPLLLDDTFVAAITGAGFMSSDGVARAATATVQGVTTIRLTFSPPPALGSDLMYALSVNDGNPLPDATGNVTDSRDLVSTYDDSWNLRRAMLCGRVPIVLTGVAEDPSALTGIYGWHRADTGLTDGGGGRATAWTAKQGSGSFSYPTSGKQPLISPAAVLGLQGLYFNRARLDYGDWTGTFPTGAYTVVAIFREEVASGSANNHIFAGPPTGAGRRHMYFNSTGFNSIMEDTVGIISRAVPKPPSYAKGQTVTMFVQSFDNAGSRRLYGGAQGAAYRKSVDAFTGTWTPNNTVSIGGQGGFGSGTLEATMFDLFIFSRTLYGTASDAIALQTLINYAVRRYGVTAIPLVSTSVGNSGMTVDSTEYNYRCTATDTWRRVPLEAF